MASNRHDEEEEAQYARLRLLIQDAAFMRPYVKRALQQVGGARGEWCDILHLRNFVGMFYVLHGSSVTPGWVQEMLAAWQTLT